MDTNSACIQLTSWYTSHTCHHPHVQIPRTTRDSHDPCFPTSHPINICPISVGPLVSATITSCALFPSPPNSPPCLTPYKLYLQTEEQFSIVLGTDSNNYHLSSSYMLYTCHVLTHSILKSALGGRHYYPHTAGNNDIETLRHRGVVNITQARGGRVGIQALVCEHSPFNIHAPAAMSPAFLKSKLSKPALSLSAAAAAKSLSRVRLCATP